MLTINDIATKLNVKRDIAYGLIHFMQARGYIETNKTLRVAHQKGKPAQLYDVTDEVLGAMVGELSELLVGQEHQPAETVVETKQPAETNETDATEHAVQVTVVTTETETTQVDLSTVDMNPAAELDNVQL